MNRLDDFKPMPHQVAAFECDAPVQIIRGGNQSGTTTIAAAKVAKAMRGENPITVHAMAQDEHHLENVMLPILCLGTWHSGRLLLPFIDGNSLLSSSQPWPPTRQWPKTLTFQNRSSITFSTESPTDPVDVVWVDCLPQHESEIDKCVENAKQFIWSTFPYSQCQPLRRLSLDARSGSEKVREFVFRRQDNAYLAEDVRLPEWWDVTTRDHGEYAAENVQ